MTKFKPTEPDDLIGLTLPCGACVVSARPRFLGGYYVDFDEAPRGGDKGVRKAYAFTPSGRHAYLQLPDLF